MNGTEFLNDKNLLNNIVKVIQGFGIVGEEIPIKTVTLVCCGKLVKNKETTSTNLHPEDVTGIGKDFIIERTKKVVFYKDWIKYNSPSPTAIAYSQRREPIKDTEGKVTGFQTIGREISENSIVYVKDASENFLNADEFKLLTEEEDVNLPKTIQGHVVHLRWKKPIVIVTTADTVTENQLLRRLPSLHLNSTKEQTEAIMEKQLEDACNINYNKLYENEEIVKVAREAFTLLKPIFVDAFKVKELIKERKPKCNDVVMRSLNSRLLDYIKFSTALHQYQREKKTTMTYYASEQDVDIGFEIFNYIYKQDFVDVSLLNSRQRKIHNRLKENPGEYFSTTEITMWKESEGVSIQQLYNDMRMIARTDNDVKIKEERPIKYGYDPFVEPTPIPKDNESSKETEYAI